MIVSIGEKCLLRNWLFARYKEVGKKYQESLLSGARFIHIRDDSFNVLDRLNRYTEVCQNFLENGKKNGQWYECPPEGIMIHYGKHHNIRKICGNLRHADAIIYQQKFMPKDMTPLEEIQKIDDALSRINRNPFMFHAISRFVEKDVIMNRGMVFKLPDVDSLWETDDKNLDEYVPGFKNSTAYKPVLERLWDKVKFFA